jgi:hypothetical protein
MSDRAIELLWRYGAVAFFVGWFPLCVLLCKGIQRWAQRPAIVPDGTGYNRKLEFADPRMNTPSGYYDFIDEKGHRLSNGPSAADLLGLSDETERLKP